MKRNIKSTTNNNSNIEMDNSTNSLTNNEQENNSENITNDELNNLINNLIIGRQQSNNISTFETILDRSQTFDRILTLIRNDAENNILFRTYNENQRIVNELSNTSADNENNIINNLLTNNVLQEQNVMNILIDELANNTNEINDNSNNINNADSAISDDSDDEDDDEDEDNDEEENDNDDMSPERFDQHVIEIMNDAFDCQVDDDEYNALSERLNDIFIDNMSYDNDDDETRINNTMKTFLRTRSHVPKILIKVILLYTDSGMNVLFQNNYEILMNGIKLALRHNMNMARGVRMFSRMIFGGLVQNFDNLEDVKVILKKEEYEKMKEITYKDAKELVDSDNNKILTVENNECNCAICQEDVVDNEKIRIMPPCKHFYHKDCIDKWLNEESNKCPLCKCEVGEGEQIE